MNLSTIGFEGEGPDAIRRKFWPFPAFLSRGEGVNTDDKFLT